MRPSPRLRCASLALQLTEVSETLQSEPRLPLRPDLASALPEVGPEAVEASALRAAVGREGALVCRLAATFLARDLDAAGTDAGQPSFQTACLAVERGGRRRWSLGLNLVTRHQLRKWNWRGLGFASASAAARSFHFHQRPSWLQLEWVMRRGGVVEGAEWLADGTRDPRTCAEHQAIHLLLQRHPSVRLSSVEFGTVRKLSGGRFVTEAACGNCRRFAPLLGAAHSDRAPSDTPVPLLHSLEDGMRELGLDAL